MSVCLSHASFISDKKQSSTCNEDAQPDTLLTKNKIKNKNNNKLVHLPANNNGSSTANAIRMCTRPTRHHSVLSPRPCSNVRTLGWLEQLAVGGGCAGVGVGLAVDVLGIVVSHQVVDVFVVGRIHVWVRRLYKVVSPAKKCIRCLVLCEAQ